jgi:hypothetical protein
MQDKYMGGGGIYESEKTETKQMKRQEAENNRSFRVRKKAT